MDLQIKKCPICKGVKRELLFDFKNALQFIHNGNFGVIRTPIPV